MIYFIGIIIKIDMAERKKNLFELFYISELITIISHSKFQEIFILNCFNLLTFLSRLHCHETCPLS